MQNVEFKAEIRNVEAARRQCELSGAKCFGSFVQIDTYFRVPEGRLKRRETAGRAPEWIWYQRPDTVAARVSKYTILSDEQARVRFGTGTLVPWKVVRKTRELWIVDNVRIHLDTVEDVGSFIEFEAMVSPRHDLVECRMMLTQLREAFEPILGEPVGASYEAMVSELADSEQRERLP
ncbi:MAG: class IV adenylate cyclase [Phycisphaerales bacterium]